MSGDWIQSWRSQDGAQHFIVGDVVGKGPQAALAVAAITTTIKAAIGADRDLHTALKAVDTMLHEVFSGHVASAYCAISIAASFEAELFNGGGRGWYVFTSLGLTHHFPRGPLLGSGAGRDLASIKVHLGDASTVFTFTDGICDGPVESKRLAKLATTLLLGGTEVDDLARQVMQLKPAPLVNDDQTMLIIKRHPASRHLDKAS